MNIITFNYWTDICLLLLRSVQTKFLTLIQRLLQQCIQLFYSDHSPLQSTHIFSTFWILCFVSIIKHQKYFFLLQINLHLFPSFNKKQWFNKTLRIHKVRKLTYYAISVKHLNSYLLYHIHFFNEKKNQASINSSKETFGSIRNALVYHCSL